MQRAFLVVLFLWTFLCGAALSQTAASLGTQQHVSYSTSYYVCKGDALQLVDGDPVRADYAKWQVWLYSQSMGASPSGLRLPHLRWGVDRKSVV